jgi:hypothetical protein
VTKLVCIQQTLLSLLEVVRVVLLFLVHYVLVLGVEQGDLEHQQEHLAEVHLQSQL